MAGMDLSAILTGAAAFLGGLVGSLWWYVARHRQQPAKTPDLAAWPGNAPPENRSGLHSWLYDGGITSEEIAAGAITSDRVAVWDPRDDR